LNLNLYYLHAIYRRNIWTGSAIGAVTDADAHPRLVEARALHGYEIGKLIDQRSNACCASAPPRSSAPLSVEKRGWIHGTWPAGWPATPPLLQAHLAGRRCSASSAALESVRGGD
jgi:hypothetical protein